VSNVDADVIGAGINAVNQCAPSGAIEVVVVLSFREAIGVVDWFDKVWYEQAAFIERGDVGINMSYSWERGEEERKENRSKMEEHFESYRVDGGHR
jgi:hypothetical protein